MVAPQLDGAWQRIGGDMTERLPSMDVRSEKRTTDMRRMLLRCTPGGVTYALHDPILSPEKDVGSVARLFLICPQAPVNEFHAEGEFLP